MTAKDMLETLTSQNVYVNVPNHSYNSKFVMDNKDTKPLDNFDEKVDKFNKIASMLDSLQNINRNNQINQYNRINNDLNNKYIQSLIKTQELKNRSILNDINNKNNVIYNTKYINNDKDLLYKFAKIESNGKNLSPNKSGYEGIFQFRFRDGDLGSKYLKKMGISYSEWKNNPKYQTEMMELALNDYKNGLKRNNIDVNPLSLYMVHNQGLGGTKAIFRTLQDKKSLPKTIRRNIINQFGNSEKSKYNIENLDDYSLASVYYNKFKNKIYN